MSNRQGASGANKSRLHNVNSVYSGKNTAATKASGPGKHGLQPLGKATAVVRRMPPPATLPSLKAEHGQDPLISIVPQGGTGWTTKSSSTDTENNKQNGSTDISGGNAPDLRPTWAKNTSSTNSSTNPTQASTENSNSAVSSSSSTLMTNYSNNPSQQSQGTAAQIVAGQTAAPPNNRDFPSLAASVAAVTGSKSSDTGSLKPQKTSAWGTNLADANVEIPHIPVVSTQQNQSGGYIGASTAPKPHVERIIPQRYISSQPPINQSKVAAKIGIREKLARFSMESKEPSVDAENKAASEQDPATTKQATESPTVTESPKEVAQRVAPQQQPPTTPTAPINQQFSQPPPQLRSQDVRQLQPSQFPVPEQHQQQQQHQQPPPPEWQQNQDRFVNGGPPPYNYDQQQKLLQSGRGEGGYPPRALMQQQQHGGYPGGGIVGQQRFDERGNPYGERQIEETGWGDDLPIDNRRGMINNQNQNRNNRYRIDSRSSTEADSNTWQGPPQHYGQQQQVGPPPPRQQMPPQGAGWYDNSGYPLIPGGHDYNNPSAQYSSGNNYNNQRSRNSSVATPDYNNYDQQQQHQKGPPRRHQEFDYRQQQQGYQGYPTGGPNYHEPQQPHQHHGHDNSQHRNMPPPNRQNQPPPPPAQQQQQQRYQQPEMPYRMLKRNDEKSAEYIAHHGGGPILQQQQQSSTEEEIKPKTKDTKSRSTKGENDSEAMKSASMPPAPKENVWEKRMEERKKEVVNPKPNSRFQQDLDYNFPSINDVPKDISEWNPPPPPPPASDSSSKNSRKGPRRNDTNGQYQHPREHRTPRNAEATPLDPETLGSSHWVQEKTGPSWDNLSIPADHRPEEPLEEDDVYTGTKREFVNSKRSRGGQFKTGDFASRDIRQRRGDSSGGITNGKKLSSTSTSKPTFDASTKRPSRAEDNFSNMGEFHAEDYKIPEESTTATTTSSTTKKPHRSRDSNTFESNEGGYDSSRRGSKRGVPRQPRGNNNWKGSERLPRNTEQRETGNEEHFERYDTSAASASMRGNGRRLAPMGGNGRGSSRFLSKHTSKPTRHKPHFEGGLTTSTSSTTSKSSNRASADRNVEGLKSPAASEGVDEWETASESSDVGGREEQQPQPQEQPPQRERKNLTNGVRNSTKSQSNSTTTTTTASDTNSVSSNSKEVSQNDETSKSPSTTPTTTTTSRTNQKNVNPASHTYLGNGVSAKSSNAYNSNKNSSDGNHQPLQQNKQRMHNADTSKAENTKENARDNRKGFGSSNNGSSNTQTSTTTSSIHMGLAGVDINDASVIVIDNQPDIISRDEFNSEEAGDFEEVLSKKQKKQRLLQVEEEKRKEQKEKEKAEKIQARKKQALQQKNQRSDKSSVVTRKSQEKSVEKEAASAVPVVDSKKVKPITVPSTASPIRKNVECDLGTSIWNSTLTAAANPTNAIVEKPHIPSPIARPTKTTTIVSTPSTVIPTTITTPATSSLTIDVKAVKDGFETFTIATSTVTTATTSACYDFAYDSTLKTASPIGVKSSPKLSQEAIKKPSSADAAGLVELNSDHVQLKEKLDKVKDFWPGQSDFEPSLENGHIDKTSLSQAHGPNVAKVKPQPQHPHDSQQQSQQIITSTFIAAPEVKATKTIEPTFNAFGIPPSQSPNLYQRGNAVFTMGPTSPFRQISSNQIYSMPTAYNGNTDFIQQPYGGHANSPPIQSYFGGAQMPPNTQQQPPSRPQSYDGMFNSNPLWNNNGIDILSTITPPLQQQPQQSNQARYMPNNSRPPSHPSTNVATMPPNGFPPTHLPPPNMGYPQQQQQQPLQQQQFQHQPPFQQQQHSNNYIPTHIPPPSLPPLQPPHTYVELMNGPPPPVQPPIGASRNNNGNNNRANPVIQSHQQNNNYRPPQPPQQMQILRPPQFNNNNNNFNNGIPFPPQQQQHQYHPQQQPYHQQPQQQQQYQGGMTSGNLTRNNQQQNRGQIQQWQKQDQQSFHQQNQQQQNMNGHPSNYGGYFNIKYSTTNQPTA